jgi:hypothetical protein
MHRLGFLLYLFVGLLLAGCAQAATAGSQEPAADTLDVAADEAAEVCAVSETVRAEPPDDPNTDPFGDGPWYVNEDRTIWASLGPVGWGTSEEKVIWIRPAGTELEVNGRRLDGEAGPLEIGIPCCYPTGFQVTGMAFPTTGCWEVRATAGEHQLTFVTEVR